MIRKYFYSDRNHSSIFETTRSIVQKFLAIFRMLVAMFKTTLSNSVHYMIKFASQYFIFIAFEYKKYATLSSRAHPFEALRCAIQKRPLRGRPSRTLGQSCQPNPKYIPDFLLLIERFLRGSFFVSCLQESECYLIFAYFTRHCWARIIILLNYLRF